MVKRLFDLIVSIVALIVLSPILIFTAVGIKLLNRGPAFYRARRIGVNGKEFSMLKLRSMLIEQGSDASPISANQDKRIFPFGRLIRKFKVDELPQLINILKGDMSVIGPRPEDVNIVNECFAEDDFSILNVRPGLASPGSLFNYTHGEKMLGEENAENIYKEKLLPIKNELEKVYIYRQNFFYDISIAFRTILVIVCIALGRKNFSLPPEFEHINIARLVQKGVDLKSLGLKINVK